MVNTILNLGAGKMRPMDLRRLSPYLLVNVDKSYYSTTTPEFAEEVHKKIIDGASIEDTEINIREDIFTFMERYSYAFSDITLYRVLEHIPRDKMLYFIYLLSTVTSSALRSTVDIIAPNYKSLAERILQEDPYSPDFDKEDIITSTELFNEINDPHQSITTPERINRLFTYEKRFVLAQCNSNFNYDGRDVYMRLIFGRV